jgi:hypothetical protein
VEIIETDGSKISLEISTHFILVSNIFGYENINWFKLAQFGVQWQMFYISGAESSGSTRPK